MNKKAPKTLKAKQLKQLKQLKRVPKTSAKYTRRKGGAPDILQAYNTINAPQQPGQPPAQAGVLGTALNDLKNNKEMFQPVYDTASSIGLLYNFGVAIMTSIFAGLFIYGGVLTKNYYSEYTGKTKARISNVSCYYTDNKKKDKRCDATLEYDIAGKNYKNNYISNGVVNTNQTIDINYDPKNPNNFTTIYNVVYYLGWGIIVFGICAILFAWGWFILSWIFKPIAALSGAVAVGDVLTPNTYGNAGNYSSPGVEAIGNHISTEIR
jgi:hypothetical protein